MTPSSAAAAIEEARRFFAQGEYARSLARCEAALATTPENFEALFILGNSLRRLGRFGEAAFRLEQALRARPDSADVLYSLGLNRLQEGRDLNAAIDYFSRAAGASGGRHPDATFNKGIALAQLGRYEPALECFREVRAAMPGSALVLFNQGEALGRLGRHSEELECYDKALALEPGSADLLVNRGIALIALGRPEDALGALDRALGLDPDIPEAHNARGVALLNLKRFDEALAAAERTLGLRPSQADALNTRGIALHELRRLDEALRSYDQALALAPGYADALCNRAISLAELRRHDEAIRDFERALSFSPDNAHVLNNLGGTCFEAGRFDLAAGAFQRLLRVYPHYRHAPGWLAYSRMQVCDWSGFMETVKELGERLRAGEPCVHPFHWLALSDDPSDQLLAARAHAEDSAAPARAWEAQPYSHEKIRLAYVSADFREHAIGYLVVGLLEEHDRSRFEVTAVSIGPLDGGPTQKRIEKAVDRFIDARGMSDAEIARRLRSLEIDIAVDVTGYTRDARTRLFSLRLAPVQVNYLGYPGTMGADFIDYIVADPVLIPEADRKFYAEKVVCLPHTYQATDRRRRIADKVPTRQQAGLPESGFVFASFNNPYKITPDVFDVWMRLLSGKPGSVLWLLATSGTTASNLRREAAARGVSGDRLVFAPKVEVDEHLARIKLVDLCLDTRPYGGHTTTSDALWAGVPVLTVMGNSFPSRVASSLLRAVGLPELVADSMQAYEALGIALSSDPGRLKEVRGKLEKQRLQFPLFDTPRFTRDIEAAYTRMWQNNGLRL